MDILDTLENTIDENKDNMEFTNWDDLDINDKLLF